MAMHWIIFLLLCPILFASGKIEIKNLELKILNGSKNGAGYVSIYNGSTATMTLYGVEVSPEVFDRVELHDHVSRKDENGVEFLEMIEIPEMEISPGSTLFLQPGGKHLMLMNIKSSLCKYKKLTFSFFFRCNENKFQKAVEVKIPIEKRCVKKSKLKDKIK